MKSLLSVFIYDCGLYCSSPSVFISSVNDCLACSEAVMLVDKLIQLPVSSLRFTHPSSSLLSLPQCFQVVSDFSFFFSLNLNSLSDSAMRQNKLFNEEVQSTNTGVRTHFKQQWLTSYRHTDRCACLQVFLVVVGCITWLFLCRQYVWVFEDLY